MHLSPMKRRKQTGKVTRTSCTGDLEGDANREQREQVLKSFDDDLEKSIAQQRLAATFLAFQFLCIRFDRFIILFRSIHTGQFLRSEFH